MVIGKYNKARIFLDESQIDNELRSDIYNLCNNPAFIGDDSIKIMPDVHRGLNGYPIGFTMKFEDRIDPRCVGVDIGCSVSTYKTNLFLDDIKDRLPEIDQKIQACVPMGTNVHDSIPQITKDVFMQFLNHNTERTFMEKDIENLCKKIDMNTGRFWNSIGTLGGGNHFIELNTDKNNQIWFTIHCGSRNLGVKVCNYHTDIMLNKSIDKESYNKDLNSGIIEIRKQYSGKDILEQIESLKCKLTNKYLNKTEYLTDNKLQDYLSDMEICQLYARFNHIQISNLILLNAFDFINTRIELSIMSMHNFIDIKNGYIRKGATSAYKDEYVLVPLSMKNGTIIAKGKGNENWNESSPHGAGRVLSRSKAKQDIDMELYRESMEGIYSTCINESTIDESPFAYKDKDMIINSIGDTVEIIDIIKPILNIKAGE